MITLQQLTAPAVEPVTLAEMKAHLRVEITDDDDLIQGLTAAAREQVEDVTGRRLITQQWRLFLDRFTKEDLYFLTFGPLMWRTAIDRASNHIKDEDVRWLRLPYAPVATVEKLTTVDANGASEDAVLADLVVIDTASVPARLVLQDTASWPVPTAGLAAANGIRVDFTVGYGADGTAVPNRLKLAIKLLAAHYYENREATTPLKLEEMPRGVRALISKFRVYARGLYR